MRYLIVLLLGFALFLIYISSAFCGDVATLPEKNDLDRMAPIINKGDLLRIMVQGHDDLTMDVPVDSNGNITFPLIDTLSAAGKMIGEFSLEMETLLSEYIRFPKVIIRFRNTFFIYGEVYKPGEYDLPGRVNVLKVITLAGGFTDFASHKVKVIKGSSSGKRRDIWVNVDDIIKGREKDSEVLIEPGDTVVVPESLF